MAVGTPESLFFYIAILCAAILIWGILLGLFKIKSMALIFSLGYITVAVYSVLKGWKPLAPEGFTKGASEAVALSWPASLLTQYLKHDMYYLILAASVLQYCVAGWVVEMLFGSVVGENKKITK